MEVKTVAMGYVFFKEKVLLVKHVKTGEFMSCGGHIGQDELITEGLLREIKEETNLDAEIIHRKRFSKIPCELASPFLCSCKEDSKSKARIQIFEYLCQVKNISKIALKKEELSEVKWFSREEVKNSDLRPVLKEIIFRAFDAVGGGWARTT